MRPRMNDYKIFVNIFSGNLEQLISSLPYGDRTISSRINYFIHFP